MRKTTKTLLGSEARIALYKGSKAVHDPVAATIGASGRNNVFMEFGRPSVTNDGVTVARQIRPEDAFEALGADLVRDAAENTNDDAGDGTTTTVVLTHAILEKGMDRVNEGYNVMTLRKELDSAKEEVVKLIKEEAEKNGKHLTKSQLFDVAKISVEDEKVAEVVTEARWSIGPLGVIIADEGVGYSIEKEDVNGYHFDRGFVSPYMVTNPDKNECILENPAVIVCDRYLNMNKELVGVINDIMTQGYKSALLIADRIEGELLQSLILNKLKGVFTTVAVNRPPSLEELEDIATLTQSTAITEAKGIKDINISHVGKAKRVIVNKNRTIIVGEKFPALELRLQDLDSEIKKTTDDMWRQMDLKQRRAKLAGGIVILRVGAKTDTARKYLKRKVDDAVAATKAALEEGIVDGAGFTLHKISETMNKDSIGAQILSEALKVPRARILANAGIPEDGKNYDVLTRKPIKDLKKAGIIDPAKVERCSVENAVSVASTMLTVESLVVDNEKNTVYKLEENVV